MYTIESLEMRCNSSAVFCSIKKIRIVFTIFLVSSIADSMNFLVVHIANPAKLMPTSSAGHMVAASPFLDSVAAAVVRASLAILFDVFDRFCFGYSASGGSLFRLLNASFFFMLGVGLLAVPDNVVLDTGTLSTC